MDAARSKFILAVGLLHTAVGILFGGSVYLAVLRDGLIGAVEPDLRRMYWFWFLLSGLVLLVLGHLAHWVEARLKQRLPKRLGWALLLLGLLASAAIPISGGWLVVAAGIAVLWQPASARPGTLGGGRA